MRGSESPARAMGRPGQPACSAYREEMRLLGLKRRLAQEPLTDAERHRLGEEIRRLETRLGMA